MQILHFLSFLDTLVAEIVETTFSFLNFRAVPCFVFRVPEKKQIFIIVV